MLQKFHVRNLDYSVEGGDNIIDFSKINIFVGANNSGKSRFLRSLLAQDIEFTLNDFNLDTYNEVVANLDEKRQELPTPSVFGNFNGVSVEFFKEGMNILQPLSQLKDSMSNPATYNSMTTNGFTSTGNNAAIGEQKLALIEEELEKLDMEFMAPNFKKVYIPMLRGLRGYDKEIDGDSSKIYRSRTIRDYFGYEPEGSIPFDVFTGLEMYDDIKKMLLGTQEQRELVRDYELFLKENFFNGLDVNLTPNVDDDVLHITIGSDEKEIYNLGDGVQTIIMMTFPLFKYKDEKLLLLIEEPEMTLHPGMQRKLLDVYSSEKFNNLQVFITTHSNHLLDITLDYSDQISTLSFNKKTDGTFGIINNTNNKEVLDLLGVRNSSVFLSNCIIWVEGISDRLYIKKFLELYHESEEFGDRVKCEEDKHYSILEYGGGNITHFNFDPEDEENDDTMNIEYIQKNNFMVADHDGNFNGTDFEENEKGQRLKDLCDIFGENNIFFKHREIENLLTVDLIDKYLTTENEDGKLRYFKRTVLEYKSGDRTSIVLNDGKIGEILKSHFFNLVSGETEPKYYSKNDITVLSSNKAEIARDFIEIINNENISFEDLDELAKELIRKIYEFIINHNSN